MRWALSPGLSPLGKGTPRYSRSRVNSAHGLHRVPIPARLPPLILLSSRRKCRAWARAGNLRAEESMSWRSALSARHRPGSSVAPGGSCRRRDSCDRAVCNVVQLPPIGCAGRMVVPTIRKGGPSPSYAVGAARAASKSNYPGLAAPLPRAKARGGMELPETLARRRGEAAPVCRLQRHGFAHRGGGTNLAST